jgi:hypothetical protein
LFEDLENLIRKDSQQLRDCSFGKIAFRASIFYKIPEFLSFLYGDPYTVKMYTKILRFIPQLQKVATQKETQKFHREPSRKIHPSSIKNDQNLKVLNLKP